MQTETRFVLEHLNNINPRVRFFAGRTDDTWKTCFLDEARTWKTEAGARRWAAGFPESEFRLLVVRVVQLGRKTGQPAAILSVAAEGL